MPALISLLASALVVYLKVVRPRDKRFAVDALSRSKSLSSVLVAFFSSERTDWRSTARASARISLREADLSTERQPLKATAITNTIEITRNDLCFIGTFLTQLRG